MPRYTYGGRGRRGKKEKKRCPKRNRREVQLYRKIGCRFVVVDGKKGP